MPSKVASVFNHAVRIPLIGPLVIAYLDLPLLLLDYILLVHITCPTNTAPRGQGSGSHAGCSLSKVHRLPPHPI